jgi:hypothetical protein
MEAMFVKTFLTRLFRRDKVEPVPFKRHALPDPEDFKGRPIIEYLKACGVREDTSRYEKEWGVTTLYFRLGNLRRKPGHGSGEGGPG